LLDSMEAVAGEKLHRTYDAGRAVDAIRVVMDASFANRQYGWASKTPLHEGLRQTWNWFTTTRH